MDYIFYMGSMCAIENASYIDPLDDYAMEASDGNGVKGTIINFFRIIGQLFMRAGRAIRQAVHNIITKLKSKKSKPSDDKIKELEEKQKAYEDQIAKLKKQIDEKSGDASNLRAKIKSLEIDVERLTEQRRNYRAGMRASFTANENPNDHTDFRRAANDLINSGTILLNRCARDLTKFKSTREIGPIINFANKTDFNIEDYIEEFNSESKKYIAAFNAANMITSDIANSIQQVSKFLNSVSDKLETYSNLMTSIAKNLSNASPDVSETEDFKQAQIKITRIQKDITEAMKAYIQVTSKLATYVTQNTK